MADKAVYTNHLNNELLKVVVKPNAKKNEILGWDKDKQALRVAIAAPADKNKANIEIIKFFRKLLKKQVRIERGLKSREKLLRISE